MANLADLSAAYDDQLAALTTWLRSLPVGAESEPSRLAGWTVRDLAWHTVEVPRALINALAAPSTSDKPLTIAGYTAHWAASGPEVASRVRDAAASRSLDDIVAQHELEAVALRDALADAVDDPVIPARRGPIRTSDFMITRINELVVHSLDLSASLPDLAPITIDRVALGISCRMLARILAERVPGHTVEVRVPPYAAIQCVDGPRHTRGTPANVVEADPVAWVELATGRATWAEAVRVGTVRASGERSDIAEYLPLL